MTFDLKRARELVWAVSERKIWTLLERTGYGGDIDKRRERQAITEICDKQFPSAIAEIERLRGEMENYGDDYVCQMKSKDARIQELEDALVEMVATNPCNIPTLCDVVHDELMCLALDGNCDFWKGCPQKNELRKAARKQLQAEGKIGPDDSKKISHLRPYEVVAADLAGMLAKSWQVTDERKAAILHCKRMLTFLKEDDAPCYDVEKITKDESVLVAMLEEAKP